MESLKNYKKEKKQERNITLVDIIVTLVIVILLSAVALLSIRGKNSTFLKAKNAKEVTIEETAKEMIQLEVFGSLSSKPILDYNALEENLKSIKGLEIDEKYLPITEDSFPIEVKLENYTFVISIDGKVTRQ